MTLSCMFPDRISAMVSLDTPPLSHADNNEIIQSTRKHLEDIKGLPIEGKTRKRAIMIIEERFKDKSIANLMASNIVYDAQNENKTVKWSVNLDAILNNF